MSTPTNPYGYPPYPEQPGEPGQAGQVGQAGQPYPQQPYPQQPYPQQPYPQQPYPTYPSAPGQPYGTPPTGYGHPPQGYPTYQQGGMPPFVPPVAPPRGRNTTLWVVLSIVGVLAVLACVACGIFAFGIGNLAQKIGGPAIVTGEFCANLQQADYSSAYDELSTSLQSQVTRDSFVSTLQQRDTAEGSIRNCSVQSGSGSQLQLGDTTATLPLTIVRSSGTFSGDIQLVKEGSAWKISNIDSSLELLT